MIWASLALAAPSVLDDPDFQFCHENFDFDYNSEFCALVDDLPPGRCPGLVAFCADPANSPPPGCGQQKNPLASAGPASKSPSDSIESPSANWDLAGLGCDGAGALLQWVVAAMVALFIAVLVGFGLRFLGLRRSVPPLTPRLRVERPVEEDEQTFAEAVDDVPDLPSRQLLERAEVAFAQGLLGDATLLARGAALRHLGEQRRIRLHRARSDHEYLEQLDEGSGDLKPVLTAAAAHRWGKLPVGHAEVERAVAAARRIVILGLLVLAVTPAFGFDRYGPAGDVGIRRILESDGASVTLRGASLDALDPEESEPHLLLLDLAGVRPDDDGWDALTTWVEAGHVLWISGTNHPLEDEFGASRQITSVTGAEPPLAVPRWQPLPYGYTFGEPIVHGRAGEGFAAPVAWQWRGDGVVVLFSDVTTFWNGFLIRPENEAFVSGLTAYGRDQGWPMGDPLTVEFATVGDSASDSTPPGALANLNLLPFVLQALLLWGVVVWWKGWPFRPPREDVAFERHSFSEHLEAVAHHYRRVGADAHAAEAQLRWLWTRERRVGLIVAGRAHEHPDPEALVARVEAALEAESPTEDIIQLNQEVSRWIRPQNP